MNDYLETFDARGHEYNEAVSSCPDAREAERAALIRRLKFQPGQMVMDAPAGGGYVADGLRAEFQQQLHIICVEPSSKFAAAIENRYQVLINPLQAVKLADASLDGVASLAGLHHMKDKSPVFREWARLLKPGGQVSVGDVGTDTGTGAFLNEFVDKHTPGGHQGSFIAAGEFERELSAAGFDVHEDQLEDVPWYFPELHTMGQFCKTLFGIKSATGDDVAAALADYIGVQVVNDNEVKLNWQLRFASGRRNSD